MISSGITVDSFYFCVTCISFVSREAMTSSHDSQQILLLTGVDRSVPVQR
jgi:hypothetical protein